MLHPKILSMFDVTKIGISNVLIVSKTDDLLKKIQHNCQNHFGVQLITPAQIDKVNTDISDMITCKEPFVLSCVFPPPLSLFTKSHINYILVSCDIHPTILYDMYLSYFVIYVDTFEYFKKLLHCCQPCQYIGIDFTKTEGHNIIFFSEEQSK
jgi:hypothetical protein